MRPKALHNPFGKYLVETLEYVGQVEHGVPMAVDLVEDVVSEQLEQISVARLRPIWIHAESETKTKNNNENTTTTKKLLQ